MMLAKAILLFPVFSTFSLGGVAQTIDMKTPNTELQFTSGYSSVSGLKMYYEIYGSGRPLVLIHGGGSTIQTTFGRVLEPLSRNRQLIAVELQSHGRTEDAGRPLSFEQDADDVAGLLKNLGIEKADFFGFSNGGSTTMQIAIRHPKLVGRIVVASAMAKRSGLPPQFFEFMKNASLENMPQQYQQAYKEVAPDPSRLLSMHNKCADRMLNFQSWSDEDIRSIEAPTLFIIGDKDVVSPEHAVEMYRLIPDCQLAILPGGHGDYIGEITTLKGDPSENYEAISIIEKFLNAPQ